MRALRLWRTLTLEAIANDCIFGIMGATVLK
jgi:hypothetical protein